MRNECEDRSAPRAMATDLYQLTMAYGYWKAGKADQEAVFHLFFRKQPFAGGFSIAAGLADAVKFLSQLAFADSDLDYLGTLKGVDGAPLFESGFLEYLRSLYWKLDVDGIPEGTAVFPHEPLLRVRGPILQAQIVETALLNIVNFQTLIATKAARVCLAAAGDPVVEFGFRRAQGMDGALSASRAAYIGGCAATSNVLAGKILGIPVKGTHAHSWVLSFDDELTAFQTYADSMPNNCILLVDTFDTAQGVRNAIEVGKKLRAKGHRLAGIRLDSGDLAYLSIEARKILDEAGFKETVILASNDLDERLIASLKHQGAAIQMWGVGTKLVTAYDQPALGGVYKLSALRRPDKTWEHKLKVSEQSSKSNNPGILQVRRFTDENLFVGDAIYDESRELPAEITIIDPADRLRRKQLSGNATFENLLVPVLRSGQPVSAGPALEAIRSRTEQQLNMLHAGIKRFDNPHSYPAGLESSLYDYKDELLRKIHERKGKG